MVEIPTIVERMNVKLSEDGMPRVVAGHYCKDPSRPRYVHIDLSHISDRCGIGMVRYDGMFEVSRDGGRSELLPCATVELAISIQPDENTGIDLAEVRNWVSALKTVYGYPIKIVSYDGWNSLESRQQLKNSGFKSKLISVDKTTTPYKQFRDAMYDDRIALCESEVLYDELRELEYDKKKDKVDHPATGTKDCADGVVGAYTTMIERANSWIDVDSGGKRARVSSDRFRQQRVDLGERR